VQSVDFRLPVMDDPRRVEVRRWLGSHDRPSPKELAEAGFVVPGWPPPWGIDADPEHQFIVNDELERAGIDPHSHNAIGIGWAGPTILHAGTDEQKERFLWPLLRGEEIWCQLFSEPDAGSDLAGLSTRAVRDGDHYVVTGQKVWTTMADVADYGILLARTDPTAPRHRGISYLLCPMRQPGITVRPIREMTGRTHFNEVFFDEAVVPSANLLGVEHGGWSLAKFTLGNERIALSSGGVLWGMGPTTKDILGRMAGQERWRTQASALYIDAEVQRLLGLRILSAQMAGRPLGPEVAVKKMLADIHGQKAMNLLRDAAEANGLLSDADQIWGFLFAPALTIGGGTSQVLANIIGESLLGLPRDQAV
jgi:alkylation response protein AidB-like acyl-CoA dehydrogenase